MTIDEGIEFFEDIARLEYDLVDTYHTDEGVYGREESYHREKAEHHEQVAMWLKELQAHREAWDKCIKEIKEWYWNTDKQAIAKDPCVVDAMVDLFIRTIKECRPKEGDSDD